LIHREIREVGEEKRATKARSSRRPFDWSVAKRPTSRRNETGEKQAALDHERLVFAGLIPAQAAFGGQSNGYRS
jgi:hypothetical protein